MKKNEWNVIKVLLQNSCCKKKMLFSVLFVCVGVAWKLLNLTVNDCFQVDMSSLFFAVAGIMPMEVILVNDISGMVKGSALRKNIQTTIATKCMFVGSMASYLLYLAFLMILGGIKQGQPTTYLREMLLFGIIVAFMGFANVFLYKFFWAAFVAIYIIAFCGGFVAGFLEESIGIPNLGGQLPILVCVLAGLVLIVLGCVLNLVLCRIFYKRDFSKSAFGASMRKMV